VPLLRYKSKNFRADALSVIDEANDILREYERQGYDLTLRQLYYQFVARGLIPNKQAEYNRLGNIVNDARLAGLIDWNHIVDRTRNLRELPHWNNPSHAIRDMTRYFSTDKWATQPSRIEVWIEKDALIGVIEGICNELDVPYFSCRGYTSQSEMWGASQRFVKYLHDGQDVHILHLGDHDPSGIDMTRDIEERIELFIASHAYWGDIDNSVPAGDNASRAVFGWTREHFSVERIALNMNQVEEYNPPPNPAKLTDSRSGSYVALHGDESWELDALPPDALADLIRQGVEQYREEDAWWAAVEQEDEYTDTLKLVSAKWAEVAEFVKADNA
jgi:hypothetical protein